MPEQRLVNVNGSLLRVHGQGRVDLDIAGEKLEVDVVMVSPLTVDAILGLNFLQRHRATIDIGKRQLRLKDSGSTIPLSASPPTDQRPQQNVRAHETVVIPPYSELVVLAGVQGSASEGAWLLEACENEHSPAAVT